MASDSVRRSLYVLFARLFSGPPNAELYTRLREGGLDRLAQAQGIDLTSDLTDHTSAGASAEELEEEYARLAQEVDLRASAYEGATGDPEVALTGYMREHGLALLQGSGVACDHLSVVLGIMGELAGQEDDTAEPEARRRAHAFLLRHVLPWVPRALAGVARHARLRFYRGLAAMLAVFLKSETARYPQA